MGAAVYVHVCVSHKEERRAAQVHVCVCMCLIRKRGELHLSLLCVHVMGWPNKLKNPTNLS